MRKIVFNNIDLYVARRLKIKRQQRGWSQNKLAKALNITFQQVQKYENGKNRVSSGRLYQLSQILETDIKYFFEGLKTTI